MGAGGDALTRLCGKIYTGQINVEAFKRMRARSTLRPGQPGTRKLVQEYGERLLRVRYRYDALKRKRYTTAEILALILFSSRCLAAEPATGARKHDASLQEVYTAFTSYVATVKSEYKSGTLKQPKTEPPAPIEIYVEGFGWTTPQTLDWYLTLKPVELKYAVTDFGILAARIVLEPEQQPADWQYDKPLRYELVIDRRENGKWIPRTTLWCNAPSSPCASDSVHSEKAPIRIPNKVPEDTARKLADPHH